MASFLKVETHQFILDIYTTAKLLAAYLFSVLSLTSLSFL